MKQTLPPHVTGKTVLKRKSAKTEEQEREPDTEVENPYAKYFQKE